MEQCQITSAVAVRGRITAAGSKSWSRGAQWACRAWARVDQSYHRRHHQAYRRR